MKAKGKFDFLRGAHPASAPPEIPGTQKSGTPDLQQSGKMGRPPGKRSDPGYTQVTAYLRKETYNAVKIRLLQDGQGREFSELVEELLDAWLKK